MAKVDHTTITPNGPPPESPTSTERRWWDKDAKEACASITACLNQLKEQERLRTSQIVRSMRLYGNIPVRGLYGLSGQAGAGSGTTDAMRDRISLNISQSVTDTATSKIGKNKPEPMFLTSGGDFRQQRKAKALNKFMRGVFYENKAHQMGLLAFRDGAVVGDGLINVYAKDKRVCYSRAFSHEIVIDEVEAAYAGPRQLHWVRPIDRLVLADAFPEHKDQILSASPTWDAGAGIQHIADMVLVRESWHLPSGPEAKDGKHLISTEEFPLSKMEAWSHDFFPFARFRWSPRSVGYWSQGLVEQIQPLQLELNKLLFLVQRSYHLGGSFKILMEMGSKVATEHINNMIGTIIKYQGVPPQYIVPPLLPPEIYQQIQWIVSAAYEQAGINRLSAGGMKPPGLNSGRALREYNDIESDRFAMVGREYEQFFLDLARISIATVKDMFERKEIASYEVRVPSSRWIETVDWKKIDLDEEQYVMQCFPISSLPNEPAGRLETVQEMMQAGLIDPRQGKRLLAFPDIEREESMSNACEDFLTKKLDECVDDGADFKPYTVEPDDNPSLALQLGQQYYLAAKRDNLEEEKLERLRVWMQGCKNLIVAAMPPPPIAPGAPGAPGAGQPGAGPQAVPAPPPVSNILPNGANA